MLLKEQTARINMQCGFRRGYSIIDNLFIIHSLFEILEFKKKKNVLCLSILCIGMLSVISYYWITSMVICLMLLWICKKGTKSCILCIKTRNQIISLVVMVWDKGKTYQFSFCLIYQWSWILLRRLLYRSFEINIRRVRMTS